MNLGRETLQTSYGERETIIVERIKGDSSYKIWADPQSYGLPLQIERIKEGKTEYIVKIEDTSLLKASEKITTQTMNYPQSSNYQSR